MIFFSLSHVFVVFIVLIVFVVFTVFVLVVFIVLEFHSHSLSPSCFAIFLSLELTFSCTVGRLQLSGGEVTKARPPLLLPALLLQMLQLKKTLQVLALSSPVLTSKPLGQVAPST